MKKSLFPGWRILGMIFVSIVFSSQAAVVEPSYRADQILVQPKSGVATNLLAAFHAAHQCKVSRTFARLKRLQVVRVPSGETVESLIAKYRRSGLVEFAEPDYLIHAAAAPNDPKFADGTLWGLNNWGQNGGTPGADIDATNAWDILTSASNIVVAVVDSGIRSTHEDLAANMWVNPNDGGHGFNAFTGTNNPEDDGGHGTLVAGVLGGVGNNGKGVTGVAWQVQLMSCKCLDSAGNGSDATLIACLDYAITNGAKIINASLDSPTYSEALSNAIVATRDAGIIFVASAGNNSANIDVTPDYPSCYQIDNIVSVAYTTRNDALGDFSNFGATNVALAAPGDQIYSTFSASDTYYYPPNGLPINIAGTSFSAPYVSGACALLLAQYPADSAPQIISRLLSSVDRIPALAGKCRTGGRLNLRKALRTIQVRALPQNPGEPFHLLVDGGLNRACVVEASTDLINWTPVATNSATADGTFIYTNAFSPDAPVAFFRATGDE
jgi:subtilisin family serine protease